MGYLQISTIPVLNVFVLDCLVKILSGPYASTVTLYKDPDRSPVIVVKFFPVTRIVPLFHPTYTTSNLTVSAIIIKLCLLGIFLRM